MLIDLRNALEEHAVEFVALLTMADSWNCRVCNSRYDLLPGETKDEAKSKIPHKPDCLLIRAANALSVVEICAQIVEAHCHLFNQVPLGRTCGACRVCDAAKNLRKLRPTAN